MQEGSEAITWETKVLMERSILCLTFGDDFLLKHCFRLTSLRPELPIAVYDLGSLCQFVDMVETCVLQLHFSTKGQFCSIILVPLAYFTDLVTSILIHNA